MKSGMFYIFVVDDEFVMSPSQPSVPSTRTTLTPWGMFRFNTLQSSGNLPFTIAYVFGMRSQGKNSWEM
jgi:hypothetical protein